MLVLTEMVMAMEVDSWISMIRNIPSQQHCISPKVIGAVRSFPPALRNTYVCRYVDMIYVCVCAHVLD